jgi:hypothetical protein
MKTFKEWLAKRNLSELNNIDPQTMTGIFGATAGAAQQTSPASVADAIAKKNAPFTLALLQNPVAQKIQAAIDAKNAKTNQAKNTAMNSTVPPNIGQTLSTQGGV